MRDDNDDDHRYINININIMISSERVKEERVNLCINKNN
jgi:hypothetical protein